MAKNHQPDSHRTSGGQIIRWITNYDTCGPRRRPWALLAGPESQGSIVKARMDSDCIHSTSYKWRDNMLGQLSLPDPFESSACNVLSNKLHAKADLTTSKFTMEEQMHGYWNYQSVKIHLICHHCYKYYELSNQFPKFTHQYPDLWKP